MPRISLTGRPISHPGRAGVVPYMRRGRELLISRRVRAISAFAMAWARRYCRAQKLGGALIYCPEFQMSVESFQLPLTLSQITTYFPESSFGRLFLCLQFKGSYLAGSRWG